jgi:exodeoxyribonuclease-3
VCLQEIKCHNAAFPRAALRAVGYEAIWRGQGPHHGVAILAHDVEPIETRRDLPGNARDMEARYVEAAVGGILIGCLYLPNGNPQPGPNSLTSWPGSSVSSPMPRTCKQRPSPSSSPAITTSCRRMRTFIRCDLGTPTRSCSRNLARRIAASSTGAGRTQSMRCTPPWRCIHFGTICAIRGPAMPECASTISC